MGEGTKKKKTLKPAQSRRTRRRRGEGLFVNFVCLSGQNTVRLQLIFSDVIAPYACSCFFGTHRLLLLGSVDVDCCWESRVPSPGISGVRSTSYRYVRTGTAAAGSIGKPAAGRKKYVYGILQVWSIRYTFPFPFFFFVVYCIPMAAVLWCSMYTVFRCSILP